MKLNTFFDFCSGIGGGRLGLEQCGLTCVGYSDTSRLSAATYNIMHNTELEKNFGNLKKVQSENLPDFDILIAGFPCQTFSVIGRKQGFNDDRGQIIFHLARHIEENKPKCFILENVRGLVSHDKGETLKIIMKRLTDCGYLVSYKVLSSIEYGVPQMRQRVYFIGIRKNINIDINDFDAYKESGTKGKDIIFDGCQKVFSDWIIDYYQRKGVKFIITNAFTIFPLDNFLDYFNITATYRVKRSGSSNVGKSNTAPIMDYITSNYDVISTNIDNTKLYVNSNKHMHDTRFRLGTYEYMFSQRDKQYEIRKLSNTFNANVIFSITLKSVQILCDLEKFEKALL
ncbi:MAG: DNA (cytosine-5-)-methyltransferase [Eubacteriales bacterium]